MYKDENIQKASRDDLGLFKSGEDEEEVNIAFPADPVELGTPIEAEVQRLRHEFR